MASNPGQSYLCTRVRAAPSRRMQHSDQRKTSDLPDEPLFGVGCSRLGLLGRADSRVSRLTKDSISKYDTFFSTLRMISSSPFGGDRFSRSRQTSEDVTSSAA